MTLPASQNPTASQPVPPPRPPQTPANSGGNPPPKLSGQPSAPPPPPAAKVTLPGGEQPMSPPVPQAQVHLRHRLIALSFLLWVLIPPVFAAGYLWFFAADQYNSKTGFSVRLEENNPAVGFLAGLTGISSSSSSDSDILFEFIQSQKLVQEIDKDLNLRAMWSAPLHDPVFALREHASLEQLVSYWNDMVHLTRGKSPGLLEVEVRAFSAEDAYAISTTLFEKSSKMINDLSAIAREDSIRYARDDLVEALERLKTARELVTRFRNVNQLVNPELDIQSQAGLLANLHSQQAQTLIEIDLLRDTARPDDPRVVQAERKLQVIEERIAAERMKFGFGTNAQGPNAYADLVGEYERLVVEREFAERAYTSALASYDTAVAESRRQSRYLAAYMEPTMPETAVYPRRFTLLTVFTTFLFLSWCVVVLIYYSAKDRR